MANYLVIDKLDEQEQEYYLYTGASAFDDAVTKYIDLQSSDEDKTIVELISYKNNKIKTSSKSLGDIWKNAYDNK